MRTLALVEKEEFPDDAICWRGTGFNDEHRGFFKVQVTFRVPGFLATSFLKQTSLEFLARAAGKSRCLWRILLDPRGKTQAQYRVKHVAVISKTHVEGEHEYLFAPYSVFTVKSVEWGDGDETPHQITLESANDNQKFPEDLPLSPWY